MEDLQAQIKHFGAEFVDDTATKINRIKNNLRQKVSGLKKQLWKINQ